GELGSHGERRAHTQATERPGIEPVPGLARLDNGRADANDVSAVAHHDGVVVQVVANVPGEALRMDGDSVRLHARLGFILHPSLFASNLGRPIRLFGLPHAGSDQLFHHHERIAHDPHVHVTVTADVLDVVVDLADSDVFCDVLRLVAVFKFTLNDY